MTPQEQQMIDGLIERIRNTQVTEKDVAAEQHLQQGLAGYPDAVYVLAQTVLVQQYGLQQAQQQIQALQAQLEQARQQQTAGGGSFLSHIFGGVPQTAQPPYQPVTTGYAPPPPGYGYPPQYAQPVAYGPPMGGGGFLRGALQTAAGVAAGEMVFEGMESLFHGFGGGYGGGRGEEIVNNYYGDSGEHRESGDSGFYNPDNDASRQGDAHSAGNFADNGNNDAIPTADDMPADNGYDSGGDSGANDDMSYDSSDSGDTGDGGGF